LQFDGRGGAFFGKLDAEKRLRLEDEREELEEKLRGVEGVERRIAELEAA
jgi:ATP-binding cassette subfamily D (ALD) long-chain fatty acid import protein